MYNLLISFIISQAKPLDKMATVADTLSMNRKKLFAFHERVIINYAVDLWKNKNNVMEKKTIN